MPLKLNSTGGGSVTLDTPSTAGTYTVTVPATNQTLGLTSGTAATASGTSVDFTGIPSWVKRITVMFNNVSTNGSSLPQIQLGSGSVTTSGYTCYNALYGASGTTGSTISTGIGLYPSGQWGASGVIYGNVQFTLQNAASNTWTASGAYGGVNSVGAASNLTTAGYVALSGVVDRIRITTVNGTDTFDAGTINIMYEG